MKLTLIDTKMAKEGYEFVNYGEAEECAKCTMKKACLNLLPGRKYKVMKVREKEHDCAVAGRVRVAEVDECDIMAAIPAKMVYPGSKITFEPQKCANILCKAMKRCRPEGVESGDACRIVDSIGRITCSQGRDLVLVGLRRV